MQSNGARHADAAHTAGRNRRQQYQEAYRAYRAEGYSEEESKARAKADAYPASLTEWATPEWARRSN
jgi:hypothetical protein